MLEYRKILEQRKGQLSHIENEISHFDTGMGSFLEVRQDLEDAQAIIQMVAQATQEELRYHINEIVTLALSAVFDDPYEFEVDFVQRRNQTEADLWFVRQGERIHPLSASGGGAVNVAAFALRVSLWSLKAKRSRPILLLDEPFSNLSVQHHIKASGMLKEISERMGIQMIIVTHSEEITESADIVFRVTQKAGISNVKEI